MSINPAEVRFLIQHRSTIEPILTKRTLTKKTALADAEFFRKQFGHYGHVEKRPKLLFVLLLMLEQMYTFCILTSVKKTFYNLSKMNWLHFVKINSIFATK